MTSIDREKPIPPPEGAFGRVWRTLPSFAIFGAALLLLLYLSNALPNSRDARLASYGFMLAAWLHAWFIWRPGFVLRGRLRDRGFRGVNIADALRLHSIFGAEAARRLPPRDEAILIPGVEAERDYLTARNALVVAAWHRDPCHYDLIARGYRDIGAEAADELYAAFGEGAIRSLPKAGKASGAEAQLARAQAALRAGRIPGGERRVEREAAPTRS